MAWCGQVARCVVDVDPIVQWHAIEALQRFGTAGTAHADTVPPARTAEGCSPVVLVSSSGAAESPYAQMYTAKFKYGNRKVAKIHNDISKAPLPTLRN